MMRRVFSILSLLVCTVLGLSIGVQRLGIRYPNLGDYLVIFDYKLYPFWLIFSSINSIPESLVLEALYWGVGGALTGLLIAFITSLTIPIKDQKGIFGNSEWATITDIKNLGLLNPEGLFLGKLKDGRYLRYEGPHHTSVIAPTRSGKGAGIVIPAICTHRGSAVVYDIKAENFQKTALTRSKFSDIYYFNPASIESAHFNPLFSIRKGINEVKDAQNLANIIVEPDRPGQIDHWVRTGNSLLTAAILHVLYAGKPSERNLNGVATLLSRSDMGVVETLEEMLKTKHLKDEHGNPDRPHPAIVSAIRDVLNKSADDRSSVVSTVMGYLSIFRDPLLANCTSDSDFAIEDLMMAKKPKTLYLVVSPSDIDRVKPVTRIILNLICRRLCEPTDMNLIKHRHNLLLALDEFPTLGRMEFFESALAFIAGFGMKALLVSQSINQLKLAYGERSSILDNTHIRVFYTPNTIETAEYISKTLGDTTVDYRTKGESGKKGSPFYSNKNESNHISRRPLLTPREVMEFPKDHAIVFVGGAKPIDCFQSSYYQDRRFIEMTSKQLEIKRGSMKLYKSEWEEEKQEKDVSKETSLGLVIELNLRSENSKIKDQDFGSLPDPYFLKEEIDADELA